MKRICDQELRGRHISMTVQERGGRKMGQELGITVPARSSKEHCRRKNYFPCILAWKVLVEGLGLATKLPAMFVKITSRVNMLEKLGRICT